MSKSELNNTDLPLSIGKPATNALHNAGITNIEQIAKLSEKQLLDLHGVGPKATSILKEAIRNKI